MKLDPNIKIVLGRPVEPLPDDRTLDLEPAAETILVAAMMVVQDEREPRGKKTK